jgi:hypothetical protein
MFLLVEGERWTLREPAARILHVNARRFVLRSAWKCRLTELGDRSVLQDYLNMLAFMVDAQGIEPWTSPV